MFTGRNGGGHFHTHFFFYNSYGYYNTRKTRRKRFFATKKARLRQQAAGITNAQKHLPDGNIGEAVVLKGKILILYRWPVEAAVCSASGVAANVVGG